MAETTNAFATSAAAAPEQPASALRRWWSKWFVEHPDAVGETYFEHLRTAGSFAGGLALCSLCCLIHALVPGLFTTSASARVERMHERMHNRGK